MPADKFMSLLNGLLRDALLQNVMKQDVYVAIRPDAPSGQLIGSGTASDPFGGQQSENGWFDTIMRSDKVQANQTVRIGPGDFRTRGFRAGYASNEGWRPKSGLRIVGSGAGYSATAGQSGTKLILEDTNSSTELTSVVGSDQASQSHFLEGFQLSHVTLDCGIGAAGGSTAGVTVNGRNVTISEVLVRNFGTKGTAPIGHGISPALGHNFSYALHPENCVVERCRVEAPAASGGAVGIVLASDAVGYFHRFCVVRDCYVFINQATAPYTAILAGGGVGTVIELNAITTVGTGVAAGATTLNGQDAVVRDNYIWKAMEGVVFDATVSGYDARLAVLNNVIDLQPLDTFKTGVRAQGNSIYKYGSVLLRNNIVRRLSGIEIKGIVATHCANCIIENNVIDDSIEAEAVVATNCAAVAFLNNQTAAGKLLHGQRDGVSVQELEDEAEFLLTEV